MPRENTQRRLTVNLDAYALQCIEVVRTTSRTDRAELLRRAFDSTLLFSADPKATQYLAPDAVEGGGVNVTFHIGEFLLHDINMAAALLDIPVEEWMRRAMIYYYSRWHRRQTELCAMGPPPNTGTDTVPAERVLMDEPTSPETDDEDDA